MTSVLLFRSNELVAITVFPVNVILRIPAHCIVELAAAAIVAAVVVELLLSINCADNVPDQVNAPEIVSVVELPNVTLQGAVIARVAKVAAPVMLKTFALLFVPIETELKLWPPVMKAEVPAEVPPVCVKISVDELALCVSPVTVV